MIKPFLSISFILLFTTNWAQQNLVPNYSFEDYSSCPPQGNSIAYTIPWFQPNYPYAGINGSSDAHHLCSGYVPQNMFTYQYPKTGNGYAGIYLYWAPGIYEDNGREYIEVKLTDSLQLNKKYCVRFYANKSNYSSYAIKQIQAVITNDSLLYQDTNYTFISSVTPILEADSIINDTLNWVPIQTTFTASGGEKFLTIGNFNSGAQTDYLFTWPFNTNPSYYVFDDVSVYELPDYNAGNDTTICPWDTMVIGPQTTRSDVQYSWSPTAGLSNPNIANPSASPLVNTTYILTVTDTCQWACNSILMDTINISVQGCLGVKQLEIEHLKFEIYPNPAGDVVFIEAENKTSFGKGVVEIYNINGEFLHNFKLNEGVNRVEIDLTSYQNGVYIFKVIVDGETTEVKRLVITK